MKILDKAQRKTLQDIFKSNLLKIRSLPRNLHGIIMCELDRSIFEMDRLIGSSPASRGMARKCEVCGVLTGKGIYFDGMKHWLCLDCGAQRLEKIGRHETQERSIKDEL